MSKITKSKYIIFFVASTALRGGRTNNNEGFSPSLSNVRFARIIQGGHTGVHITHDSSCTIVHYGQKEFHGMDNGDPIRIQLGTD